MCGSRCFQWHLRLGQCKGQEEHKGRNGHVGDGIVHLGCSGVAGLGTWAFIGLQGLYLVAFSKLECHKHVPEYPHQGNPCNPDILPIYPRIFESIPILSELPI